jgi:hypothetical protein
MKDAINVFIKISIIILILSKSFNKINKITDDNNTLDYYFSYSICTLLYFANYYNCSDNIFINNNIYEDIVENEQKISLFINIRKTKIENIFLLIGIIPFLKNYSTITYKINKKDIYKIFKNIFKNKKIKNKIIKINDYDLHYFLEKFNDLINYKWEFIPNKELLNNIRYIINNYYNNSYLEIFDKSLNLNFKYFLRNKKEYLSLSDLNALMSK